MYFPPVVEEGSVLCMVYGVYIGLASALEIWLSIMFWMDF